MRTSNWLKLRLDSWGRIAFLGVALALFAVSTSGCKTTNGKGCGAFCSGDPEKLATVNEPDAETTRAQADDGAANASAPSQESKDRHNSIIGARANESQTSPDSVGISDAPASLAAEDDVKNAPVAEALGSMDFMPTTTNPTSESNLPEVTPAPKASIQPQTSTEDPQISNDASSKTESTSATGGFISVAPSKNQGSQGEIVDKSPESEPGFMIDDTTSASVGNVPEPPVEGSDVATFAEEASTDEIVKPSETSSDVSNQGTVDSNLNETSTPENQKVDPKQDAGVPVTFKPVVASRVVEIQTTGASETIGSNADVARRNAKRPASGAGLVTSETKVGKAIDASKDVARLTRIRRR